MSGWCGRSREPGVGDADVVSVTSPLFVTLIVNVAVPPLRTCCESGVFATVIAGWITVTSAVSVAVTSAPTGGVPVAVAEFAKLAVTFGQVQL